MHTTLTEKGQMKVHFYNPNPMIFQKKHLNDVGSSQFFPFPSSYHHNLNFVTKKTKNMGLDKINLDIKMDFMNLKF
jgi:hypothetical protein